MDEKTVPAETIHSAQDLNEEQSDEGDSPETSLREITQKKNQLGIWQRLKRAFYPSGGRVSIREGFSEALKNGDQLNSGFSPDERAMLDNILLMREVRVEDVMVPRADIIAVDRSISLGDLTTLFETSGHSRMPVFSDNLDDPKGMVHIKDLLAYFTRQARNGRRSTAKSTTSKTPSKPLDFTKIKLDKTLNDSNITRTVLFVPASMLASDLLKRMQATRTQMALVIDEYGGTDGLVSLEDIVEIVVGDIEDEHDDIDGPLITEVGDDVWQAEAKASLEDLSAILGVDFSKSEMAEDVDTMGGLIFAGLGRVPVRGEVVRMVQGFEFHIIEADARRIKRIRILRLKTNPRRRIGKQTTENDET